MTSPAEAGHYGLLMKRSLRSWLWRVPLDQEVDEELALHVELRTRELVERGMDPKRCARDRAVADRRPRPAQTHLCGPWQKARTRDATTRWIEEFRDDVRLAMRQLVKAPGFALVATITLALGIGVNSAIFALVDATLLRPLPFHDPDRLVAVWERTDRTARGFASPLNMSDWNERTRIVRADRRIRSRHGRDGDDGSDGTAETVSRQWVRPGFFDVLGVKPVAGRMFV